MGPRKQKGACLMTLDHYWLEGGNETERERGKEAGKEGGDVRKESDERMSCNIWRKKQVCISLLDVLFFPWSISFCGSEAREGRGQDGGRQGGGGRARGRSKVIIVFVWFLCVCVCQPAISCCQATAPSLDAWRRQRSGVSCCPGTPAERRPEPTPESHRPPSLSDQTL